MKTKQGSLVSPDAHLCAEPRPEATTTTRCPSRIAQEMVAVLSLVRRVCAETWPKGPKRPHTATCTDAEMVSLRRGIERAFLWRFAFDALFDLALEKCRVSAAIQGSLPKGLKEELIDR